MEALSAKHVQSPFKRVLYRNDIKHVKVKTEERITSLMGKKSHVYESVQNKFISLLYLYFIFLLHPIDNTLAVQYQLVQGRLNHVYIRKKERKRKLEWRRAHYSKTNCGPLTRLTLFYYSFVIH